MARLISFARRTALLAWLEAYGAHRHTLDGHADYNRKL